MRWRVGLIAAALAGIVVADSALILLHDDATPYDAQQALTEFRRATAATPTPPPIPPTVAAPRPSAAGAAPAPRSAAKAGAPAPRRTPARRGWSWSPTTLVPAAPPRATAAAMTPW